MTGFTRDDQLDYARLATPFAPGEALQLDMPFRRAHLPLVAPDHPDAILQDSAAGYLAGRHERIWSLVIPVKWALLEASPGFRLIDHAMRQGPLAAKLGWDVMVRRRHVLHATIAGALARGQAPPDHAAWRGKLRNVLPFRAELRGLFSGNINLGRLYFKLYPEWRDGGNAISALQRALDCAETRLYVVGYHLLNDHLDLEETGWLAARIDEWRDLRLAEFTVDHLALLGACDDQALDSIVAERLRLG